MIRMISGKVGICIHPCLLMCACVSMCLSGFNEVILLVLPNVGSVPTHHGASVSDF